MSPEQGITQIHHFGMVIDECTDCLCPQQAWHTTLTRLAKAAA